MDIRILTLLVLISVVGSFAEFQAPFVRTRRNGIEEVTKPHIADFVQAWRTKRAISGSNDSTTSSTTSKSNPTPSSTDDTPASTSTPSIMTTTESTPKPKKPTDSGTEPNPEKPPASSGLASRSNFEPSESEPKDSDKKPELKSGEDKNSIPSYGFPTPFYPGFPSFAPAFAPNYIPDYSSYNPYRGDPAFNSIPGAGNYAWTGTSNAGGNAAASASASASSGSYADPGFYGSAPSFSSRGGFVDNTPTYPAYGNTGVDPSVYGPNTFAFPAFDPDPFNIQKQMDEHFRQLQAQFEQHQRAIFDQNNRLSNDGLGNTPGLQGAYSSINVGPRGGFQTGAINPPVVGIESRFAEDVPAPSGNSFGVFSSSSSSSRTGPDGKQITHKSATTGVNDNGKITYRTVHN